MTLIIAFTLTLIIGYVVAIAFYLLQSMVVTISAPHFVPRRGHFRTVYLLLSYLGWLLYCGQQLQCCHRIGRLVPLASGLFSRRARLCRRMVPSF